MFIYLFVYLFIYLFVDLFIHCAAGVWAVKFLRAICSKRMEDVYKSNDENKTDKKWCFTMLDPFLKGERKHFMIIIFIIIVIIIENQERAFDYSLVNKLYKNLYWPRTCRCTWTAQKLLEK